MSFDHTDIPGFDGPLYNPGTGNIENIAVEMDTDYDLRLTLTLAVIQARPDLVTQLDVLQTAVTALEKFVDEAA